MLGFLLGLFGFAGSFGISVDSLGTEVQAADTLIVGIDSTDTRILTLNRVVIIGNNITRDKIILRELSLQPGDTVTARNLYSILERDRKKIYNLRLFNTVSIRLLQLNGPFIDLLVEVTERWYTFPVPIFELSDRNFNEWIENYGADLGRVNYGLRLYQYNFRGRNETLRFTAQFGFTREFDLAYRIPYIDRKQKQGLTFNFSYGEPKNMSYRTEDHKLVFLEASNSLIKTLGAGVSYTYRKSFYTTHSLDLSIRNTDVADTVIALNPNYFTNGSSHQRFASLAYSINSDYRDVQAYPLTGYQLTGYLEKAGLGFGNDVDQWVANLTFSLYKEIKEGLYYSNLSSVFLSTANSQPYSVFGALGYRRQLIRGYEVYVIEGPKFFLNKATLKKRIFSRAWQLDKVPVKQFRYFPLSIFLKGYVDFGYVENYPQYEELSLNERLSNRLLGGAGMGVDVVLLYDTVWRFEYTFTREGTRGFFFHLKKEF